MKPICKACGEEITEEENLKIKYYQSFHFFPCFLKTLTKSMEEK